MCIPLNNVFVDLIQNKKKVNDKKFKISESNV